LQLVPAQAKLEVLRTDTRPFLTLLVLPTLYLLIERCSPSPESASALREALPAGVAE